MRIDHGSHENGQPDVRGRDEESDDSNDGYSQHWQRSGGQCLGGQQQHWQRGATLAATAAAVSRDAVSCSAATAASGRRRSFGPGGEDQEEGQAQGEQEEESQEVAEQKNLPEKEEGSGEGNSFGIGAGVGKDQEEGGLCGRGNGDGGQVVLKRGDGGPEDKEKAEEEEADCRQPVKAEDIRGPSDGKKKRLRKKKMKMVDEHALTCGPTVQSQAELKDTGVATPGDDASECLEKFAPMQVAAKSRRRHKNKNKYSGTEANAESAAHGAVAGAIDCLASTSFSARQDTIASSLHVEAPRQKTSGAASGSKHELPSSKLRSTSWTSPNLEFPLASSQADVTSSDARRSCTKRERQKQEKSDRIKVAESNVKARDHIEWVKSTTKALEKFNFGQDPQSDMLDARHAFDRPQKHNTCLHQGKYHSVMESFELTEEDCAYRRRAETMDEYTTNQVLVYSPEYISGIARLQILRQQQHLTVTGKLDATAIINPLLLVQDEIFILMEIQELSKFSPVPGAKLRGSRAATSASLESIRDAYELLRNSLPESRSTALEKLRQQFLKVQVIFPLGDQLCGLLEEVMEGLFELEEVSEKAEIFENESDVKTESYLVDPWPLD
jgi:hypothetical protein